jgi:hypothetical protein
VWLPLVRAATPPPPAEEGSYFQSGASFLVAYGSSERQRRETFGRSFNTPAFSPVLMNGKVRTAAYFFASFFSSWRACAFSSLNWRRSSSAEETALWMRVSAASVKGLLVLESRFEPS